MVTLQPKRELLKNNWGVLKRHHVRPQTKNNLDDSSKSSCSLLQTCRQNLARLKTQDSLHLDVLWELLRSSCLHPLSLTVHLWAELPLPPREWTPPLQGIPLLTAVHHISGAMRNEELLQGRPGKTTTTPPLPEKQDTRPTYFLDNEFMYFGHFSPAVIGILSK